MPSHAQAARVADGGLDLAICWLQAADLDQFGLQARLIGADRLYAVAPGTDTSPVRTKDALVLLDADADSWSSWNLYAAQLARDTGAEIVRTEDGGVTGPAFFEHVRRLGRPIVNSPKGHKAGALPADLVRRPLIQPTPCWTWSLVARRDEARAGVLSVIDVLAKASGGWASTSRAPGCRGRTCTGVGQTPTEPAYRTINASPDPDRSGVPTAA